MPTDPWVKVRTRHDFPADEVISALQKEIRRGNVENAALLAYELLTTSAELEAKLWIRLLVISVEDVGLGDRNLPILINALYEMAQRFDRAAFPPDRGLFAIHAVRLLASSPKDRSSDEMYNWIRLSVEEGDLRPVIPDYAIDMHTARGQALGRDVQHFLEEGARVQPELEGRDRTYRERVLNIIAAKNK
jgi:replication-associated recombination protein RarA